MNKEAHKHLSEVDPILSNILHKVELEPIENTHSIFHDLMSCVIEQQIHYRSTKNIFKNLLANADITLLTLDNFPIFEEQALSQIKLSERKFETIHHTVTFFTEHSIDWLSLDDNEVRIHLKSIKGIGVWTIDMILLYSLERSNILSYDDFHLKNMMQKLYYPEREKVGKKELKLIGEKWAPFKSLAFLTLMQYKKDIKKRGNK
ncbi:DNA-3-methyladenine glycosylase 2 family protein [Flammeovirga sp. MY04]|uniref:DNA-3-methyladenine glycosylase family protein n=1 Tax=Flammeovirga sp. MY04 TaxID=1191459 RepID=UPI00080626D4|nr:DNA-3-methyladenine glycosylase [Flammeovirga sp. MY04]ANQ47950.1 DNA-3-methyladenine glycosylase 2 family protein [Flammeovirga sp. MY04]